MIKLTVQVHLRFRGRSTLKEASVYVPIVIRAINLDSVVRYYVAIHEKLLEMTARRCDCNSRQTQDKESTKHRAAHLDGGERQGMMVR